MVLMIVSGRSGSGKSVALRALEDMGFYCVDNLPVVLLPDLARTLADREISAAVSIDVRNMPESPEIFEQAMSNLPDAFSPQCQPPEDPALPSERPKNKARWSASGGMKMMKGYEST